jgi:hypothetical protein
MSGKKNQNQKSKKIKIPILENSFDLRVSF